MSHESRVPPLSSDAPISGSAQDVFGRKRLAQRVAVDATAAAPNGGFVIALCGAWGTGKTSVVNLVKEDLARRQAIVVTFNPWLFSGAEDLVGTFLSQLAATLRRDGGATRAVANKIARYAGALGGLAAFAPVVGDAAASALKIAQQAAAAASEAPPLYEQRAELVAELQKLDMRIVVFVDDVDRLTDDEIRDVVRLVKLVGDLPRITYILVFDRVRVEEALAGAPGPFSAGEAATHGRERGRAYLEKIVQSRHDVPPLRPQTLMRFLSATLDEALDPYLATVRFHEHDWANIAALGLREMIKTPRDAKRLGNAASAAADMLSDEVALVDTLALEALRVFEPDVHAELGDVAEILVDDRFRIGDEGRQREEDRARIDALLTKARQPGATRKILVQLFPKAHGALGASRAFQDDRTERRELRVSQPSVFRAYLHTVLDDDALAALEVARIAGLVVSPGEFEVVPSVVELRGGGRGVRVRRWRA